MKKTNLLFLLTILLSMVTVEVQAQDGPLWLRYPAISPDGKTIAFAYQGNIFTVSSNGGEARQLTSHTGYDAYPVWSPDGKKIAFASTRKGSYDVYLMDANGGTPTRLTTSSGSEKPMAFLDNDHVLFTASVMPTAKSIIFPGDYNEVYSVSVNGGRPALFSAIDMNDVCVGTDGAVLYHDHKGYEDPFRKHHTSPITRDIWMMQNGKFTKVTDFKGEDRTPRWAADGKSFFYTSEEDGTFNVYRKNIDGSGKKRLTEFKRNPVRFLSVSKSDDLCFTYDGEIYVMKQGQTSPSKVKISIFADTEGDKLQRQILSSGATEMTVSPNGKEVAFVLRGDIYVTNVEFKTTKQITDTPEQERNVQFSPDGKSLVYAAERDGLWQIYQTRIRNKAERQFAYATDLDEERLVQSDRTSQLPKYSPDGKKVAFLEDRGTIRTIDLKTKEVKTCLDGKYMYSYSDGDVDYNWSPDGRWFVCTYIGVGGWNNTDLALVSSSGNGEIHNLTNSGYSESNAKWVLGGKALLFQSDRAGYRSHGSWGAEDDAYLMFLDVDAYDRFNMTKEEKQALLDNDKKKDAADTKPAADAKKKKDSKKKGKADAKKAEPAIKPLELDLENCQDRIVRLTVNSSHMGDMVLSQGGDTLYYMSRFEGNADLWMHDMRNGKTEIVMKGVGSGMMEPSKDGKSIYILAGSGIRKFEMGSRQMKSVEYEARFNYRPYDERKYMFDHVWRQVKDKFYLENLHGVDWQYYREAYAKFLPYITNNYDFADLLSEMLGELNASHTGARYRSPSGVDLRGSCLGLFLDHAYTGDGLKVEEVIKRGPFAVKKTGVKPGCIIEKIDGEPILAGQDYNYMLDGKAGRKVRIGVYDPAAKKRFEVIVKPITLGAQNELLYKRWVDRNRQIVDSISGGKVAYVHVKAMDSPSFRTVYRELLSDRNRNRQAVIVDDRHNGGGWLHDDLCTLLSGKEYQQFVPRGNYIGRDPFNKWTKKSCVLMCEDDYSNGHGFPKVYSDLKIGKLIGTPVAGTMTAVWWENLIDDSIVFGIPQVGCRDMSGKWGENTTLYPDIEVYNSPEDFLNGHDTQLERAVEEMMK